MRRKIVNLSNFPGFQIPLFPEVLGICGEGGVGDAGNNDGSGVLGIGRVFVALDVDLSDDEGVVHPAVKIITIRIITAPGIKNRNNVTSMTNFCACTWYISLPI